MNALHQELQDVVSTLFRRHPALCGFSLQQDMKLMDLACHPMLLGEDAKLLQDEILEALLELVEERPEVAQELPGRTFARSVH